MEGMYTIAEIARRLRIPESTIRYYRDRFPEFVPSVGQGRNRRYPQEAQEALRAIAEAMRSGVPEDIVRDMLRERFPVCVDTQQDTAVEQQQDATMLRAWIEDAVKRAVSEALEERDRRMIEALEARQKALDEALAILRDRSQKKKKWRWWRK